MKKHLLIASVAVACSASAVYAQESVLKDAERAQKSGKTPVEVVEIITPAFTNPETSGLSMTYFIPGKAYYADFDHLFGLKSFGKLPENGDVTMGEDLLNGYDFFVKALPLDTVIDAKGKPKTKYSKEIVNTVAGHVNDYNNAAIAFWEAKNYDGAYRAWEIYLSVNQDAPFADKVKAPADTILGEIYFNQALAAWQADNYENTLKAFENARRKGYHKKQLYDYAIAVANTLKNQDAVFAWASEGNELYGADDANYLGYMINTYLQNEEFDKAFQMIDEAIANDPGNSQYYFVKGILYDNQKKKANAKEMFKKAIELNPENANALAQYGAALCQEAYALSDEAPASMTVAESQKYYDEKLKPLFEEAAIYLEKAWQIDNNNYDALRYLENVYYNLHDDAKQEEVRQRMLN